MKKYIVGIISAVGMLITSGVVHAATITVSPTTVSSTGEGVITFSAPWGNSYQSILIFDGNGNYYTPATTIIPTSGGTWSDAGIQTGLPAGNYTIYDSATNSSGDLANLIAICGGQTLSYCSANANDYNGIYAGIHSITIQGGGGGGGCTSGSNLNASGTGCAIDILNTTWYSYFLVLLEKFWPFVVGVIILLAVWFFSEMITRQLQ